MASPFNKDRAFNPRRLKEARIAKGLSAAELAQEIGLSRQAVSLLEGGDTQPKAETIMHLSYALGFPRSFFYKQSDCEFSGNTFFRASSSMTKKVRESQLVKADFVEMILNELETYIDFPEVNLPPMDDFEGCDWNDRDIEELTIHCRNYWKLGIRPIDDVVKLLETNGIIVTSINTGSLTLDAFCQPRGRRPLIVLSNDKQSAVRRQFDSAHELGHLLMHKELVDNQSLMSPQEFKRMENQAHRFASALLLPEEGFAKSVRTSTINHFTELKAFWKASIGAMVKRCKDLGIIDEVKYTSLQKQISTRKIRTREPLDDVLPVSEPKVLKQAIGMIIKAEVKTPTDLLYDLDLPAGLVEEICNLKNGFFHVEEYDPKLRLIEGLLD
jgi:Zn-dependent peptidase ImmA (M78 family)/transcriptional regulator with XRE-family HTH domain